MAVETYTCLRDVVSSGYSGHLWWHLWWQHQISPTLRNETHWCLHEPWSDEEGGLGVLPPGIFWQNWNLQMVHFGWLLSSAVNIWGTCVWAYQTYAQVNFSFTFCQAACELLRLIVKMTYFLIGVCDWCDWLHCVCTLGQNPLKPFTSKHHFWPLPDTLSAGAWMFAPILVINHFTCIHFPPVPPEVKMGCALWFLSTPVLMHGRLICIALRLSVCLSVRPSVTGQKFTGQ